MPTTWWPTSAPAPWPEFAPPRANCRLPCAPARHSLHACSTR
jgi:hypothetical protein